MDCTRFRNYCWAALGFVVLVILWGALVRATGSGAGCGSHWPTCNGAVLPLEGGTKTFIELTHRVTSGLSVLVVIAQLVWARRLFPSGHRVRAAAGYAMLFMAVEVLIGAAIVKLHYVADNQSIARAWWIAIHLSNTFLLLGALTLTAHWSGGAPTIRFRGRAARLGAGALAAMIFTGASGGIAALGDTLQPASSTGGAVAQLSATGELLVQLRIMHPFIACGAAMFILFVRHTLSLDHGRDRVATWGRCVRVGIVAQVLAGFVNVMMLAPTWMQLVHLLLADAVWIVLVLFLAEVMALEPTEEPPLSEATESA